MTPEQEDHERFMRHIWRMIGPVLLPLFGAFAGGVSSYLAIRVDLAELRAQIRSIEKSADRANTRLDSQQGRQ